MCKGAESRQAFGEQIMQFVESEINAIVASEN